MRLSYFAAKLWLRKGDNLGRDDIIVLRFAVFRFLYCVFCSPRRGRGRFVEIRARWCGWSCRCNVCMTPKQGFTPGHFPENSLAVQFSIRRIESKIIPKKKLNSEFNYFLRKSGCVILNCGASRTLIVFGHAD